MRQPGSFILVLFLQFSAHAVVDMKNAAFSEYWVDIMLTNNTELFRVSRTYSSRSLFSGIFGFGWCSNLETKLEVTLEGNLILNDCGMGAISYYPANYNTQLINQSVDRIIDLLRQKDASKGKKYYDDLKEQIRADHKMRTQIAGEVGYKITPGKNTIFLANGREAEKIIYDGSNYVRNLSDGSSQRFGANGQLLVLADKSKKFLRLTYAANGLPTTVTDNVGNRFTFTYTNDRKVKQITGPNNLTAKYKFTGENLVSVTNSWQNTYNYTYDTNHNLTRISLPDGTYKTVSYVETKDWVKEFRDRDGCVENYDFTMSTDNPKDHYWATAVKTCKGKTVFKSRYEFWYQMRPDKEKYLSRVLTEKNGTITDISYHQDFPKPIAIRKNSDLTTIQYMANGLIKQKTVSMTPTASDEAQRYSLTFSYDPNNRIDEATTEYFTKAGKSLRKRKTQFKYDMGGRLTLARSSEGQFVEIKYNTQGLISGITDQQKKEIVIEYDPKTLKPTAITRPQVGSIQLAYGTSGELKKVQNKGGSSVNTQVYAAFSNFLEMVGPVSTELSLNL